MSPLVRGDNPRALASGLSYVQVDKHGITIFTTYISIDFGHHEIFHAKVGKGGINIFYVLSDSYTMACPPVRGDNPRALTSGLSYVHVDRHDISILYHLHQCRPCTS